MLPDLEIALAPAYSFLMPARMKKDDCLPVFVAAVIISGD